MRRLASLGPVLLVSIFVPTSLGGVLVVAPAPGPGVGFTSVQNAVDAAQPGDVVLVREGLYGPVTIAGKGLTVIAEEGADVRLHDPLTQTHDMGDFSNHNVVTGIPAGQRLVLRGLEFRGLEVENCSGAVWIESCTVDGTAPALRVDAAARLDLLHCVVEGPDGFVDASHHFFSPTGDAAVALGSTLAIIDCALLGGTGKDLNFTMLGVSPPHAGGSGLVLEQGASAWIEASTLQGGAGGDGGSDALNCFDGREGGDGLRLENSTATLRAVAAAGGAGGAAGVGSCPFGTLDPGAPGQAVNVVSGSAATKPGGAKNLTLTSPVREQQATTLVLSGAPNDVAALFISATPAAGPAGSGIGVILLDAPIFVTLVPLGPSGSVPFALVLPFLPPGVQSAQVFAQAAFCAPGVDCFLGAGAELTVLDGAF